MDRREVVSDAEDILRKQAWYLNPSRWLDLFSAEGAAPQPGTLDGSPLEEVVDDLDEYDRYFANLDEKRFMTGAQLFESLDQEGWQ